MHRDMNIPSIPIELVDLIIDHAHADREVLASCSLVCRAWLLSTRYHMFSQTKLDAKNASSFVDLIYSQLASSSGMIPFLRRIEIMDNREDSRWFNDLIPRFSCLTAVTELRLNLDYGLEISTEALHALHRSFPNLVSLKLVECSFDTFSQVQGLICSFPSLEELHLEAEWESPFQRDGLVPPKLRDIYLRCELTDVLGWFLSQSPAILVPSVTLHIIDEMELPVITRYLQTLGSSLMRLTIVPYAFMYDSIIKHVSLSHNDELQILGLVIDSHKEDLAFAEAILSTVTSPYLQELSLSFRQLRKSVDTQSNWESLDCAITTKPEFSSIRRLSIEAMMAVSLAKENLPQCNSRGIVRTLSSSC